LHLGEGVGFELKFGGEGIRLEIDGVLEEFRLYLLIILANNPNNLTILAGVFFYLSDIGKHFLVDFVFFKD
jgi:hypothetical protein